LGIRRIDEDFSYSVFLDDLGSNDIVQRERAELASNRAPLKSTRTEVEQLLGARHEAYYAEHLYCGDPDQQPAANATTEIA
jgi:hypothetical protein